ncbi:hypothetical protein MD484_g5147, partial [Candolleomyces efflorescens]
MPPDNPPGSQLLEMHHKMKGEIEKIINSENKSQELLKEAKNDLSVSKRAYSSLESEFLSLRTLKEELEKQRDELLGQVKPNRLVVLIDGDGAIFNLDLIAEGQNGGHKAASKLSDAVMQHLPGRNSLQLWVYVFLNRRGLSDTFVRVSRLSANIARQKLDDFIVGFNQAAERFIMVDVGNAKEAADAKIKAVLEVEVRSPQTECIVFGGCHDNGYATALRSFITSGLKSKIILLQSYDEIASGIKTLDLPTLSIPGLFLPEKLNNLVSPQMVHSELPTPQVTPVPLPSATIGKNRQQGKSQVRAETSTPEFTANASCYQPPENPAGGRKVDYSLPLWQQKPPACHLFYFSPGGSAEVDELRASAKKIPCSSMLKVRLSGYYW